MDFSDIFDTDVTVDRAVCSQYLIRLRPTFCCFARAAEHQEMPIAFEQPFLDELSEWLYLYKNKIYIMEYEGELWGFVSTLFPSSAMVFAIRFNDSAGVVMRCLSRNRYLDRIEFSPNIKVKKSRSTKIDETQKQLDCFFEKLNDCFFKPYLRYEESIETIRDFEFRCLCFSKLIGTPVKVEQSNSEDSVKLQGEIDFPFLSAFLVTILLLSREFALDRSVRVSFRMLSQSVAAVAEIIADEADLLRVLAFWDSMCADLFMPFGAFFSDGSWKIGFQPCRRELSYLGLKQQTDWLRL